MGIGIITNFLAKGHRRSRNAKKHILISFVIKGMSVLIGFATVPITLGYVNEEQYGIWLTLSSIVGWLNFFNIGLGSGLRNKLAESLATNDLVKAKIYVSTTYGILSLIFGSIAVLVVMINPLINWSSILNISSIQSFEINLIALITICSFCFNVVLRLLHTVLFADQRPSNPGILNLTANIISLLCIVVLTRVTEGSLLNLSLVLGLSPLLVLSIASIIFYHSKYRDIAPSFSHIDFNHFNELIGLGFKFFVVSISSLVIFSTDNFIITQIFGPSEVPAYAISHKFFSLITIIFSIIGGPFWSAYTEAYVNGDFKWISNTNKKLKKSGFH